MIKIFVKSGEEIIRREQVEALDEFTTQEIIWVDLLNPTEEEKLYTEEKFGIELVTRQEAEEIEISSKYAEDNEEISINSNFLLLGQEEFVKEPISFILRKHTLISQRTRAIRAFNELERKLRVIKDVDCYKIFLNVFDIKIDADADFIEGLALDISRISKELAVNRNTDTDHLLRINQFQEKTMLLRENVVEKQRILSAILKSNHFPKYDYDIIRIMLKDVGSLLDHSAFNFERLEYMQNTFLGLVDIEQNRIIKIFTVVTVVFMPPTLIASIYGMNFQLMPELQQSWGYPFALAIMLLSSVLTLLYFKKKNWL